MKIFMRVLLLSAGACAVSGAYANAYGTGKVDLNVTLVDAGPDISVGYDAAPSISAFAAGNAWNSATNLSNNVSEAYSEGTSTAHAIGSASQTTQQDLEWYLYNSGTDTETVAFFARADVYAAAFVGIPGSDSAFASVEGGLYDGVSWNFLETASVSGSSGLSSSTNHFSDTVLYTVAPGQGYWVAGYAYVATSATSTAPSPAAIIPFGLGLAATWRRRRQAKG